MKLIPMTEIETPRLLLRKIRTDDLENYHARLTSDPQVAEYMLWDANPDIAHTAAAIDRIRKGYADGTRYHWGIALKTDNSLFGTIVLLRFREEDNSCSFAYMLGKAFWGKGYATEAVNAVFRCAFDQMEIQIISADHFAENPASGAVMAKAGMKKTALLPGQYEKNGILHDAVMYTITEAD